MTVTFSAIEIEGNNWDNILMVRLSGKLTKEDYEKFVPEIDRMMKAHDKVRMLVELADFHGWTTAAWEDTKFGLLHFNDIEHSPWLGYTGPAGFLRIKTVAFLQVKWTVNLVSIVMGIVHYCCRQAAVLHAAGFIQQGVVRACVLRGLYIVFTV